VFQFSAERRPPVPARRATGSSVGNGSGTMRLQTTIWQAEFIKFQVAAKMHKRAKEFSWRGYRNQALSTPR
jgi:hypothetical protein